MMKKFLLFITALASSATMASAQAEVSIAPEIGGTFVTMSQKFNGTMRDARYQAGFRVGANVDIGITDHFTIQPGLFFSGNNGAETTYENNYFTGSHVPANEVDRRRYHINYLQVPVNFLYKTADVYSSRFFIGGGPYLGVAVGGRFQQDYSNTLNGQKVTKRRDYPIGIGYTEADEIGRMDFGFQATTGYELPFGLYFRLSYGYSILDSSPIGGKQFDYHQSGGSLSVGYLIKTYHYKGMR